AAVIPAAFAQIWLGPWGAAVLAWPLVAVRSLDDHVRAVARPLAAGDLAGARAATAMIVGRDVTRADEAALARASIESLAENASDGVIAPLFWAAIGGLPGIAAYKAINTLDSMIGHRTPRHEAFGAFAARLDDVANLIPARLTAALLVLVAGRGARRAAGCALSDAGNHRSPNAGWPEAAMAGALGVRLSGPRHYGCRIAPEPWLNGHARDPAAADLFRALRIYRRAVALMAVGLLAFWAV
ncbi:MAG: adenosylcobinamide-phosphate synthase CbiB, partial [Paracoccus sp. (in: a-proteobacteria)]